MKPVWKPALRCEQSIAHHLFEMEQYGWLVDEDRIDTLLIDLEGKIQAIDKEVLPGIPLSPVQTGATVKEPFKKDGTYKKLVVNWLKAQGLYEVRTENDPAPEVVGPFSKITWQEINLGSDKQVKDYLLSIGWVPTEWNTSKKSETWGQRTSPKLTEDSFDSLKSDIGKLISKRMIYKHRYGLIDGLKHRIREDGRIGQVISGMTPTYRCTHKDIVNIPGSDAVYGAECRSIFIAKPGYKIVGTDAASCQLRMLCHYMQDDDYTKSVLFGKKEDKTSIHYVNMYATDGMITDVTTSKRFIYAFLFGGGDEMLGRILGGSKSDGNRLRKKFLKGFPALDTLLKGILSAWKKRGYLVGLDGRKVFVRSEHMLLVYLLQSAEAILMKYAILFAINVINQRGLDAHLVAFVHDEMQFEVREDQAEEVGKICEESIRRAGRFLKLTVPADGEADIGYNWGETH